MNKSSCILQPENDGFLKIHKWQVEFCKDNHCAALLLSFFSAWHDWKLKNDEYYRKANNIAEVHGDGRPHNENAYLFFSTEDLIEGTLGFYGKNAINEGIQLLASLGVLTIHKNPNPRYHFDKTKYFQFNTDVCNEWIVVNYSKKKGQASQPIEFKDWSKQDDRLSENNCIDQPKRDDRSPENKRPSAEIGQPSSEKGRYITNNTNNTTNKDQSIQNNENLFLHEQKQDEESVHIDTQQVIDALISQGFPSEKLQYPDVIPALAKLQAEGATLETFIKAYDISIKVTNGKGFGANYLIKTVESLLKNPQKIKKLQVPKKLPEAIYKNDLRNAMSWASDIISDWEK